jgi:hypothetical protein
MIQMKTIQLLGMQLRGRAVVQQVQGPVFNPQHCKKKEREKEPHRNLSYLHDILGSE